MVRSKLLFSAALLMGCSLAGVPAMAQQNPGAPGTNQVIPEKDRALHKEPSKTGDTKTTGDTKNQTLTEKLDQTNGVIKPPANMDPEMHKPTPNVGTMPVIPPPGTPKSDHPHVEPK